MKDDNLDFLNQNVEIAAPRLLGCYLERTYNKRKLVGKIVEVEAYDQSDAASHSYRGKSLRTDVMFEPCGHMYVYFTYGMHYCSNVVCGPAGQGAAILIRALEPLLGTDLMEENRNLNESLTNGPAKLCQAMKIDKTFNGHNLNDLPLRLIVRPSLKQENIVQTTRIGISKAIETPWRFFIKDNPFVSKPAAMIG